MKNKIFNAALLLLCVVSIAVSVFVLATTKRAAYVDTFKLYEGYKLKQQLKGQLDNFKSAQQKQIDSLALMIRQTEAVGKFNEDEMIRLKNFYAYKQQNAESDYTRLLEQYNTQVWNQLNQYMGDYGKAKGFDIILGGRGDGSVMYVKESLDITQDAIKYVNDRFDNLPQK